MADPAFPPAAMAPINRDQKQNTENYFSVTRFVVGKEIGFKLTQKSFFNYSGEMDPNAKALFGEGFTREGGRLVARSPP
jgi:hypothetical protein